MFIKNSEKVNRAFDRAADNYDQHSLLQYHVGKKLIQWIDHRAHYKKIVDLGCGTGLLTKQLALHCMYDDFYAIDFSRAMIEKARFNLKTLPITPVQLDFEQLQIADCDLLFANMSLHWSTNFLSLIEKYQRRLSQGATLIFSIPVAGTLSELPSHQHNYFYSSLAIINMLKRNHQVKINHECEQYSFYFSTWREALNSIKRFGGNSNLLCYQKGLSTKENFSWISKCDAEIKLTYNIGYFKMIK